MHELRSLALLVLVLAACADQKGTKTCTPPECTPAASSYAVEIVGNAGSTLPATELTQVVLDSSGVLALDLGASVQVSGHVTSAGKPVPASVVFTRPSAIAGRPDVSYETSVALADGSYNLSLPPNVGSETYTVRVRPTDGTTYPPLSVTTFVKGDTTLELPLPSGDQLVHFHGSLANAVSIGLSQVKVVLRDATTLDDLSTTTTTGADGSFDVVISRGAASGADGVVIVAQQGDPSTGLITLTVPVTAAQLIASPGTDAMALKLPPLPSTTHLSIPVVGTASSGTVTAVTGATFRMFAPLATFGEGESVLHEVDGQTDASGKIQADLFSDASGTRTYYVTIVPPAGSSFEATRTPLSVSVGAASGVVTPLTLASRPLITGRVLDPEAVPLEGATVQPAPSTIVASLALPTSSALASATTDGMGRFPLYLDPGTYDLAIIPPATAKLPRRWLSHQVITGDLDLRDVQLGGAVRFDLVLTDSSQQPVQATVRLYVLPASDPDCASPDMGTGCVAAPQLQAEAATGADGTASILLPALAMPDLSTSD